MPVRNVFSTLGNFPRDMDKYQHSENGGISEVWNTYTFNRLIRRMDRTYITIYSVLLGYPGNLVVVLGVEFEAR